MNVDDFGRITRTCDTQNLTGAAGAGNDGG
jgi:hypothetical protein